jgi:hypothetical protein
LTVRNLVAERWGDVLLDAALSCRALSPKFT